MSLEIDVRCDSVRFRSETFFTCNELTLNSNLTHQFIHSNPTIIAE